MNKSPCIPIKGFKRRVTSWLDGTTECVKTDFCFGANEDLTGSLNEFRAEIFGVTEDPEQIDIELEDDLGWFST